jgi:hypothetical protein
VTGGVDEVNLKLDRALEHIEELDREVDAWIECTPYDAVATFDPSRHGYAVTISRATAPPDRLSVLVGDAVYGMRSALDHLMYRLSRNPENDVSFPIRVNKQRGKDGRVREIDVPRVSKAVRALVRSMQPYKFPEEQPESRQFHWLALLQTLSAIERQRHAHPVIGRIADPQPFVSVVDSGETVVVASEPLDVHAFHGLDVGEEIAFVPATPPPAGAKIEVLGCPTPWVAVDEPAAVGDEPFFLLNADISMLLHATLNGLRRNLLPAFEPFLRQPG